MTRTRRSGAVAMLVALAGAVALLALLATTPADAAPRYKVVTKTFQNTQPITILQAGAAVPYPSETNAGGFKRGKILDANLTLKNFSHTWPADVDVMLSHGATNRTVMSDVGSSLDALNITLNLDDEAAAPMPEYNPLTGGTFKPTNVAESFLEGPIDYFPPPAPAPSGLPRLSGFDGANPNGPWQLWISDDSNYEGGQFAGGWSVTIKARVLR